jgi:diguanylate cyclase (GGDEF)-like protein
MERGPEYEDARLAALYQYDVLDTAPEESFDRITRLVRLSLGVPTSVVSLVDRDRQWFKSRQGCDDQETPRNISFCTHTIQQDEPLVIPNALEDPRFVNSPLVTREGGVRMYVGVPLRTPSGFNIGALCAIDSKPGTITDEQLHVMQDLARLVVDELELRKLASVDSLTGAMTGRAFAVEVAKEISRARRYDRALGVIMFDLDHFKKVNDTYGHAAGDHVLRTVASLCQAELRGVDVFARVGGEEFAILLPETSLEGVMITAERLRETFAAAPITFAGQDIPVTGSFGATVWSTIDGEMAPAMKRADAALYEAKHGGRNRVVAKSPPSAAVPVDAHAAA